MRRESGCVHFVHIRAHTHMVRFCTYVELKRRGGRRQCGQFFRGAIDPGLFTGQTRLQFRHYSDGILASHQSVVQMEMISNYGAHSNQSMKIEWKELLTDRPIG